MILFIIIAICILLYTIFAKSEDGLIWSLKRIYTYGLPFREKLKEIGSWFWMNVLLNAFNAICVFGLSVVMLFVLCNVCPKETTQYEFNINALQDNLVTQGRLRGSMYGSRGYVDGELSYFFSRTMSQGEIIGHIPAKKTYVQYSSTERPHIEVHQDRANIPDWLNKVLWLKPFNKYSTDYYVIVVPEGTITNSGQYEIDMK